VSAIWNMCLIESVCILYIDVTLLDMFMRGAVGTTRKRRGNVAIRKMVAQ